MSVTHRVVDRFVAGETIPAALSAMQQVDAQGASTTLDVLGESVTDRDGAFRTRDSYLALIDGMTGSNQNSNTEVSIKLSALGQALPSRGEETALELVAEICAAANASGVHVTLDMEDHATIDSTLRIATELRNEYPWTGTVLQSNLRRTLGDLEELASTPTRIRLVKGAYKEPATVAFQSKTEVDAAYQTGILLLASSRCYPMIGTHDPAMIHLAQQAMKYHDRGADDWELQMLYGVRGDLQSQCIASGTSLRVYIPFGTDWYPYFMRRLAERPANVAFFLRALTRP
jgi:proline dehydrogenase